MANDQEDPAKRKSKNFVLKQNLSREPAMMETKKKMRNEEIPMEKSCAININFPGNLFAVLFHWNCNFYHSIAFDIRTIRHTHTNSNLMIRYGLNGKMG